MRNSVKYIIDYKGYGNTFDLTNTRNGEHTEIDRDSAMDYVLDNQHREANGYATDTYFSFKADVSLRSVPQVLIA
tara:strand:- start:29427 stop:29651 length:225 start_codon:yes stop_codon:yes gene_type:complete